VLSRPVGVEWRWLVNARRSDHANLLLADVNWVGVGLNFGMSLLAAAVTMLAYLGAALALSWQMTGVALLSWALVFALLSGQRHKALGLGQSLTNASRALHGNVHESLTDIKLAKILGAEQRHLDWLAATAACLRARQLQFVTSTSVSKALFQVFGATLLAGYLYVGLHVWHTPAPELLRNLGKVRQSHRAGLGWL
jgi:ATP-binding cassette, subfamily C, bacterial